MKKLRYVFMGLAIILLFGITYFISYYYMSFKEFSYVEDSNDKIKVENITQENIKQVKEIKNILLIGSDAREGDEVSRSDAMIVLTIDGLNNSLKLSSIMRDTLVEIPNKGEEKINHAFAYGGAPLLMETIEKNFNIPIDKYMIVDFSGFKNIVDALGGVDVEVKEKEVEALNDCLYGIKEKDPHLVTASGDQHLDGQQTLAYVRMRYVGHGGYERTQRQREVIEKLIEQAKKTPVKEYANVIQEVLKCIKTNIEPMEAVSYIYSVMALDEPKLAQLQIPASKLSIGKVYLNKGWVLISDKDKNKKMIEDFIYNNVDYNEESYPVFSYEETDYYREEKKLEEEARLQEELKKQEELRLQEEAKKQEEIKKEEELKNIEKARREAEINKKQEKRDRENKNKNSI